MSLFIVIASLCTTSTGVDLNWAIKKADKYQLKCQKYYVNCLHSKNVFEGKHKYNEMNYVIPLAQCIDARK